MVFCVPEEQHKFKWIQLSATVFSVLNKSFNSFHLQIKGYSWFEVLNGFVKADGVWGCEDFDTIQLRLHHICAWCKHMKS